MVGRESFSSGWPVCFNGTNQESPYTEQSDFYLEPNAIRSTVIFRTKVMILRCWSHQVLPSHLSPTHQTNVRLKEIAPAHLKANHIRSKVDYEGS
jgi:hypothetical protein